MYLARRDLTRHVPRHLVSLARLGLTLVVAIAAGGLVTQSALAAGTAFRRGDVFLTGNGIQEYAPTGELQQTVAGTSGATLLCFDPSGEHLIVPGVGLFDSSGNALPSRWASVTGANRCVADGYGHVYISAVTTGTYSITQYGIRGRLLQTFRISDPELHALAIDIAPDECTIYYGSWGTGPLGAIRRFNACTRTQGPIFNADSFVDDLRVLPDSQVLVTDDLVATLFDVSGHGVRSYRHPTCAQSLPACSDSLRTMSLDPAGTTFWVCCSGFKPSYVPQVFRFDIATGQTLADWAPASGAMFAGIAVYSPPLLGDANVEATVDSSTAGTAEAFTTRAGHSGQMSRLHVYVDSSSTARQAVVGVYSNHNGHPGTLQAQATISDLRAGSWNYVDVPAMPVTAGQRYWTAVLAPRGAGTLRFRDTARGGRSETSAQHNLMALPARWSSGNAWSSAPLSAHGS